VCIYFYFYFFWVLRTSVPAFTRRTPDNAGKDSQHRQPTPTPYYIPADHRDDPTVQSGRQARVAVDELCFLKSPRPVPHTLAFLNRELSFSWVRLPKYSIRKYYVCRYLDATFGTYYVVRSTAMQQHTAVQTLQLKYYVCYAMSRVR
jgi:hypothetical protein